MARNDGSTGQRTLDDVGKGRPDAALLESVAGREDDQGAEPGFAGTDDVRRPLGATPASATTGRHDDGTDANETVDGLNETEELTRRLAEDVPAGRGEARSDTPVFEKGRTPTGLDASVRDRSDAGDDG